MTVVRVRRGVQWEAATSLAADKKGGKGVTSTAAAETLAKGLPTK